MAQDLLHYDKMVESALRGVVREALARVSREGLRGGHHFYVGFATRAPGVVLPPSLLEKFPEEMTIVLQHQYWDLEVGNESFSITLSFQSRPERLTVPFAAILAFSDPSVKFGLKFEAAPPMPGETVGLPAPVAAGKPADPARPAAEILTLDKFRKR